MLLTEILKARICQFRISPNYPLWDFVHWANNLNLDTNDLLQALDAIQTQLEAEALALRRHCVEDTLHLVRQEHWHLAQKEYRCFYCSQIRSYYRVFRKHPEYANPLTLIQQVYHQGKSGDR